MKRRFLLLLFMAFGILLSAQPVEGTDTLCYGSDEMKKIFIVRKTEAVQPINPTPLIITETEREKADKKPVKNYNSKPSMVSDEDGLMNLVKMEPFPDAAQAPKTERYVVFSFSVNEWGFVSEIVIYDTNDRALVDTLIQKLDQTRWKPAVDTEGKRSEYNFGNWIAKIPSSTKSRRYEDYRF